MSNYEPKNKVDGVMCGAHPWAGKLGQQQCCAALEAMEPLRKDGLLAICAAAAAVAKGAAAGAESTHDIWLCIDRACSTGERAAGFTDPGAVSVSLILGALAETPQAT